jgi:type 1 glutamine amidotransferase
MHVWRTVGIVLAMTSWAIGAQQAPGPRKRAEVEAVLAKAPKAEGALKPLNILLVAGPKDHGPGEHDYPKWQKEWAPLLAKGKNVKVTTAFPWPKPEQWEGVDVAVFYLKTKWTGEQVAEVKRLQDRGAGVVSIHWAIGADQDWLKHAERFGLSYKAASYRHGITDLKIVAREHPVARGFPEVVRFVDEPYWPFIGDPELVKVIGTSDEKVNRGDDRAKNPGDETVRTVPVFWTYEPKDSKGRAFVSVFGHYVWTFDDPLFRLLLLRGIAWAGNSDVYRLDELAVEGVKME